MNRLHHFLHEYHAKSKQNFQIICGANTVFRYGDLIFHFKMATYRIPEKMIMSVEFPSAFGALTDGEPVVYETYLLNRISPVINELNEGYINRYKDESSKAHFYSQSSGVHILKRSGLQFNPRNEKFVLKINLDMPMLHGNCINYKPTERTVKDILRTLSEILSSIDRDEVQACVDLYHKQQAIRKFLSENRYCAFVANGSILPRAKGTDKPMSGALPFVSPPSLAVTIPFDDGTSVKGMGIKNGVTVITGGGYSGKSTLLDALEEGIYDRLPGDGLEFVITDRSALKTFAEDGRPVSNLDLSPFFRKLPGGDVHNFTTHHASGSVSQGANIVEAICGGCNLLLVDEDKSATNLMIRDSLMRQVVKKEPIIPFTDRVNTLYEMESVSTVLVIGGCGEYLSCADCVILMEDYIAHDITKDLNEYELPMVKREPLTHKIQRSRRLIPRETDKAFLFFRNVATENEKKIILDDYSADITMLSAIKTGEQMNLLSAVAMWILCDREADCDDLIQKLEQLTQRLFERTQDDLSLLSDAERRYYEEVRPIDAYCCLNRMRGAAFKRSCGKHPSSVENQSTNSCL